jgi:ABC-2 type transport system permease protein
VGGAVAALGGNNGARDDECGRQRHNVFLAIGTLVSSFTENVVIAYVGALFALLVLYTIGWLGETVQGPWGSVVKYVSITDHFQELLKGLIDTKDLVYFATVLVVSLFLTQRSVESVRWR